MTLGAGLALNPYPCGIFWPLTHPLWGWGTQAFVLVAVLPTSGTFSMSSHWGIQPQSGPVGFLLPGAGPVLSRLSAPPYT